MSDTPVTPLTPEQLEFFTEQSRRAVQKGVRDENRKLRSYVRRATVGFCALAIGIGTAFYTQGQDREQARHQAQQQRKAIVVSGTAVAVDSCNRGFHDRESLRNLLLAAQATISQSLKRGDITEQQAEFARQFYAEEIRKLALPDCRLAANLLTDDPNDLPKIPEPLYPPGAPVRDAIFSP